MLIGKEISDIDLNTLKNCAVYGQVSFSPGMWESLNVPSNHFGFLLSLHFIQGGFQLFQESNQGLLWYRYYWDKWYSWKKVSLTS